MALVRYCYNVLRTAKNHLEFSRLTTRSLPTLQIQSQTVRGIVGSLTLRNEEQPEEGKSKDPAKNREIRYPVETSIQYLESEAYQETYGSNPVWKEYRRNHKGTFAPFKTRKTCIRQDQISVGNPCPICRDEYLVLDYRNINLLKQFICPHTGSILNFTKTGLCQRTHRELVVAIEKARDYGFLPYDVPNRVYDYSQYNKM